MFTVIINHSINEKYEKYYGAAMAFNTCQIVRAHLNTSLML